MVNSPMQQGARCAPTATAPPVVIKQIVPKVFAVVPDLIAAAAAIVPNVVAPLLPVSAPIFAVPISPGVVAVNAVPVVGAIILEVPDSALVVLPPGIPFSAIAILDVLPAVAAIWTEAIGGKLAGTIRVVASLPAFSRAAL